eukprot:13586441-Alexandrium_andersonii.AAC.1
MRKAHELGPLGVISDLHPFAKAALGLVPDGRIAARRKVDVDTDGSYNEAARHPCAWAVAVVGIRSGSKLVFG